MTRKCDITRRRDITEKCLYALCLSLLVCLGFHNRHDLAAVVGGPSGCTKVPAFTAHAEIGIADSNANLPAKAPRPTEEPPAPAP